MSNQLLFAMIAGELPLDSWAKRVNPPFAHSLNKQRGRLGPIFSGRPTCVEVPAGAELDVIAYVHNSPVRRKIVNRAVDISWSSHRAYVGHVPPPPWLHVVKGLALAGYFGRLQEFDEAVGALKERALPFSLASRSSSVPRAAENRVTRQRHACEPLLEAVAIEFGISIDSLKGRSATREGSDAKRVAIHAARELGIPLVDIANALGVSRQRTSLVASTELSAEQRDLIQRIVQTFRTAPLATEERAG
jgi:hypothetical protein